MLTTATNAVTYLDTPTPDGSGQMVHPDVYDAGEGQTWNGYRYWMACTPYTYTNAGVELPCVLVSNDGQTWVVPEGGTNPIRDGVCPDPDIVVDTDGTMMYYIDSQQSAGEAMVRSTTNGIAWTEPSTLFTTAANGVVSPALVRFGEQWLMFSVKFDAATPTNSTIERRTCTTVTGEWSAPQTVAITIPAGLYPWHLDVIVDGSTLYMALDLSASTLYLVWSTDGGTTWSISTGPMLEGRPGHWDAGIYRSTFLRTFTGFDLWYSANDNGSPNKRWNTGFTTVLYQKG